MDFKELMNTTEYDSLRTNERLGNRIMLLGLGGSYAYGTNNEGSDIDFRGVTLMMPSDLLGLTEFEQYEDDSTDSEDCDDLEDVVAEILVGIDG